MHCREVGSFEAKTHFAQILTEVSEGNEVIITKHGKPVALISPFHDVQDNTNPVELAIETVQKLRKNICLNNSVDERLSIQAMKEKGRR